MYKYHQVLITILMGSLSSFSSLFSLNPSEFDARLNATEILGLEMNTKLQKTEAEMEALKTADQGKQNITDPF